MSTTKTDIRKLSLDELTETILELGEKKFRAKQIYEWLWRKSAWTFEDMTNLSKDFRQQLDEQFAINHADEDVVQKSNDGTIKVGFKLHDDNLIEGVLIPTASRMTACVSSQVGCSLQCAFCATGFLKRQRNLEAAEIYDQVVLLNRKAQENYGMNLSNIVFMGMGEPLMNFDNLLRGIELITTDQGLEMSAKRITVSTVGIARQIKKLADMKVKFNLALSLHAATDEKRLKIMPINKSNNLESLVEALTYFFEQTKNKITFEYILFNEFNDTLEDARNLVNLSRRVPSFVNVIEYNDVEGVSYTKASAKRRGAFIDYLEKNGITAKVRLSRGKDIDAACGQLANKH